ncbi:hypothetical protein A4G23_04439 [Streptomyces rubrolavendulae]|uniref:Transposase DDE domain protein n=1 Tax=Streptomyces rubrolavendulae TaxID=285473 RepID=A0A1D8G7X3_9ACTN|nr:hypothetical protein A4G23_04439 [Streptomyces rubrolavendulae]
MRPLTETVKRSDPAGWAQYGYCASHSASSGACGCTWCAQLQGLPVAFALTGAKADEGETLLDLLAAEPHLISTRPGQTLIGDRSCYGRVFAEELAQQGIRLPRPTRKGERQRPGVIVRDMKRILALTAVIWHNDHTGQDTLRSLTSYDHRPLESII